MIYFSPKSLGSHLNLSTFNLICLILYLALVFKNLCVWSPTIPSAKRPYLFWKEITASFKSSSNTSSQVEFLFVSFISLTAVPFVEIALVTVFWAFITVLSQVFVKSLLWTNLSLKILTISDWSPTLRVLKGGNLIKSPFWAIVSNSFIACENFV